MRENRDSWESIYTDKASYLQYPNEALVISYHRIKKLLPSHITCLDYGFGSGNNAEFIINKVDTFYGLEVSQTAKKITSERLKDKENFKSKNLYMSDNRYIESFTEKFDLIIAWHVIYYNTHESVQKDIEYLYKYLKKDGILITTFATRRDTSFKNSIELSKNTFQINNNIPDQQGCIVTIPKDKKDFESYFQDFHTLDIGHEERVSYKQASDLHSHYYGIFQKL